MTVSEVAAFLQVAETFVYRHATEIGVFKVGSHLRFSKGKVQEWLDRQVLSPVQLPDCRSDVDNELMERLVSRARRRSRI